MDSDIEYYGKLKDFEKKQEKVFAVHIGHTL